MAKACHFCKRLNSHICDPDDCICCGICAGTKVPPGKLRS